MFDFLDASTLIYRVPALLIALSLHEYAHAVVSDSLGDPTPSMEGRLTINPLKHLDIIGTIMLLAVGFGWAKPVSINPNYYKDYRSGVFKVSLAGPGMNFFVAFLAVCINVGFYQFGSHGGAGYTLLWWIMVYNAWFGFFNLIPVPPLDGAKVLSMLLPGELSYKYEEFAARFGIVLLMLVIFSNVIPNVIRPLANAYLNLCFDVVEFVFGVV